MHKKLHHGQINGSWFIVGEANFGGPIPEEGEGKRSEFSEFKENSKKNTCEDKR